MRGKGVASSCAYQIFVFFAFFVAAGQIESKNCIKQRFWALKVAPWTKIKV